MLRGVRLKKWNRKKGFTLRSYVSATSGIRYKAGEGTQPSTWKYGDSITAAEVEELRSVSEQFEIKEFSSEAELLELVQFEMEEETRRGNPAVRAVVEKTRSKPKRRDLSAMKGKKLVVDDEEPADEASVESIVEAPADFVGEAPADPVDEAPAGFNDDPPVPPVAAKPKKSRGKKRGRKPKK